jgi:mannose-1-phosphate guanylyltransferase
MKILIFAGGTGTRLWPLSRSNSPKQFEKMFDDKSTLQLAVDRVRQEFGIENIYISTNKKYENIVLEQIPDLYKSNLILEPTKRDLAAAVGLSFMKLKHQGYNGPVAILWADHIMKNVVEFVTALKTGKKLIQDNPNRFVYLAEKPLYPEQNIGWITVGDVIDQIDGINYYKFEHWVYRPNIELCKELFNSGKSLWNPGYWVTSIDFVLELYNKHMPSMYTSLQEIIKNPDRLDIIYPELESISFDDAIIVKTKPEEAVVIKVNMQWKDPGTLYAFKSALSDSLTDNYAKGNSYLYKTKDSLVYNAENNKLVTTIGLDGYIVVNTEDALLVCHKDSIPDIKNMLNEFDNTDLNKYK